MHPLSPDDILARMENYCAYRERCPKEVRLKLKELGAEGEDAQQIYKALEADVFFDERRFAMAYAGGKFRNNNWGKLRIRLELRMREIAPEIIQEALEAISVEAYEAVALKLLQKKLAQAGNGPNARGKAAGSVIRAGFEPELVFALLKG